MSEKNAAREQRIVMEIIVDAHDSEEQALSWYYYLEDMISFPFSAECIAIDKHTPLKLRERITVTQMSGESHCRYDMYVDISWQGKVLAIPLIQIRPLDVDGDTSEAIDDWHYWKKQGYEF